MNKHIKLIIKEIRETVTMISELTEEHAIVNERRWGE